MVNPNSFVFPTPCSTNLIRIHDPMPEIEWFGNVENGDDGVKWIDGNYRTEDAKIGNRKSLRSVT